MKKIILFLLLIVALSTNCLQAQDLPHSSVEVNNDLHGRLKVQRYYRTNLYILDSANTKVYCASSRTVSLVIYNKLKEVNAKFDIGKCTPCFLETYDVDGKIIRKSASYTDCPIGKEVTYYLNGKPKSIGYWRDKLGATWKDFKCGRTGDWLYYSETGKIVRVECHNDDKPY